MHQDIYSEQPHENYDTQIYKRFLFEIVSQAGIFRNEIFEGLSGERKEPSNWLMSKSKQPISKSFPCQAT